jgi:hypothetical protein
MEDGCPIYRTELSVIPIILLVGSLIIIVDTGTNMKAYIKPSDQFKRRVEAALMK